MLIFRALCILWGLMAFLMSATLVHARHTPATSWIVFVSDRGGTYQLYRMLPDGSQVQQITFLLGDNIRPKWSPDGQWLVFQSTHHGNWDLYRVKANGDHLHRLTDHPAADYSPRWAGPWIIFESRRDGHPQLYRILPNGSRLQPVTTFHNEFVSTRSPDGKWRVFESHRDGNVEIYRIWWRHDLIRLTDHPAHDIDPTWSPLVNLPWQRHTTLAFGLGFLASGLWLLQRRARFP